MLSPAKQTHLSSIAILFLPLLYFLGGTLLIIITSFYIISNPPIIKKLRSPISKYYLYKTPPKLGSVLGASTIKEEARSVILEKYLRSQNNLHTNDLADNAKFMIETAEKYGLDWRLIPAIAGQESTFCRTIPFNSNNCWGWAIHETYTRKFTSLEEAIERVGKSLREDFVDKGLLTPCEIMTKYTPASVEKGGTWCKGVEYFMIELENYSD